MLWWRLHPTATRISRLVGAALSFVMAYIAPSQDWFPADTILGTVWIVVIVGIGLYNLYRAAVPEQGMGERK